MPSRKPRPTHVLYLRTGTGRLRVGTFRCTGTTIPEIRAYLSRRMPRLDLDRCEVARHTRRLELHPRSLRKELPDAPL